MIVTNKNSHYPVMFREINKSMEATKKTLFIDCTLGMGGHSENLLKNFPDCKVIGIDVDEESLVCAKKRLSPFGDRFSFKKMNFVDVPKLLDLGEVSGIIVDPGISMFQLKDSQRGFSHSLQGPLDMRKDRTQSISAEKILNSFKEDELIDIFQNYGDVDRAKGFAKHIIELRLSGVIFNDTVLFRNIIEDFYKIKLKKGMLHPAAKIFQALRIYVNRELEGISEFIEDCISKMSSFSRMAFLSFHSIEDRIVKKSFKSMQRALKVNLIKPFPQYPSEIEVEENPPSKPAKLRVVEVVA